LQSTNHVGILTHPIFIGANLLKSGLSKTNGVILSDVASFLSFKNPSSPRSLMLNIRSRPEAHKISIFSQKEVGYSFVHTFKPYQKSHVFGDKFCTGILPSLLSLVKTNDISSKHFSNLEKFIHKVMLDEHILSQETFRQQTNLINQTLWSSLFNNNNELVEVSTESVITSYLASMLRAQEDTIITRLVLSHEWRQQVNNIISENNESFLFWGVSENNGKFRPIQLFLDENILYGENFSVEITAKNIAELLEQNKLIPNLFFSKVILSLYAGFKLCGGFFHVDYMRKIKSNWMLLLQAMGESNEVELVRNVPVENLIGTPVLFLRKFANFIKPATGLDLLGGQITCTMLQEINKLKVIDLIIPAIPTLYNLILKKAAPDVLNKEIYAMYKDSCMVIEDNVS
jgi:hypothetical protein